MKKKILIVGGGAAGVSAAIAARKTDRKAQIIVIEQEKHPVYERGGIPFVIGGEAPTFEVLVSARALGDYQALKQLGRRVLRITLKRDVASGLSRLTKLLREQNE